MNLLGLLPKVLAVIAKVTGLDVVKQAGEALAGAQLSPEKQAELQEALATHEEKLKELGIEELKAVMSESLAEINSSDKFTSRARPFGVYVACVITAALAVAEIAGVKLDTGAVVTLIAPLWGQTAWYTYQRTREKMNGNGSGG
jgi:hypothetical protein